MIYEYTDDDFSTKDHKYKILKVKDVFVLKRFLIPKKPLLYAFAGGMWYTGDGFSFEQKISLPYPFSTYYTTKILDKKCGDAICRSLYYVKMPLVVLQFKDECICIEFDPVITIGKTETIPFISLSENEDNYIISFYLFNEFYIKEKEHAWLGIGRKKKTVLELKTDDEFKFSVKIKKYKEWTEAIRSFAIDRVSDKVEVRDAENVFKKGKQALFRSYDHLIGSFLQLPWRNSPGFTFVNSSYSLLSYEAVRLHYFTKWYEETGDKQFLAWSVQLRNLFTNPKLYTTKLRRGKGTVWYNMTNLTRDGLEGYFYMDCGYGGYPGGQGTIAFHLLQYLRYNNDKEIEDFTKKSLDYIITTQNANGSWPMATRHEGLIGLRPEKLNLYETHGGTAECIRALLAGYNQFKNKQMKNAALKGLHYLENRYPICYNGLRDIGIREPEAFSAVSIVDAYLDAYELTKDKKHLNNALMYAYYTLTWIYFYDAKNLKLKYGFHPISYSITPRLSPYESVWLVSTYLRLYNFTRDKLWKQMAKAIYTETTRWITNNGGLCEGIFPRFLDKLQPLPMEQTFATVELLRASSHFFTQNKKKEHKTIELRDKKIEFRKEKDIVVILYDKKEMIRFDVRQCKVIFIRGAYLNKHGISFSFFDSYSLRNRIKMIIKKYIRGRYGKFVLGVSEAKYVLNGVHGPKKTNAVKIDPFEKHNKKNIYVSVNKNSAAGYCKTVLHKIEFTITATKKDKKLYVSFEPLSIKVLDHDVSSKQILFPIIGSKLKKKSKRELYFEGFTVTGDFNKVITTNELTAVDQTLVTNWTHGGVYKGRFGIVINVKH